ncbi:Ribosomal RNA adenine dimethylase [Methanosarcina siciliae HI350]|uniref:Ribosomal RNA adenine dimethylase n=1 Tax=Methanosarcina siciliae HI350 TaxID=1434119 RepID=A0A0E3PG64_9EURY|nr:class I SAM-dependent methyltransferase [Methanosarcina siciliae]AKB33323.1 Ribosomal RNA adenine dimethylase [Methanosarcina siciliae HI350]
MTLQIDWETVWAEGIGEMNRLSNTSYWNRRAEDYSDMVLASDCNHGRNILDLFEREGLLKQDWHVLDIASGPGAITVPFAERGCRVTAVEPAERMAAALMSSAQERRLSNIDVIPQTWQEVDAEAYAKNYDLVVCCHALWQFPDILPQIRRMEAVSRGYCCLAHGFEAPTETSKLLDIMGIDEGDFDQFITILNLLNDAGVHPNVNVVDYALSRSVASAVSYTSKLVEKYRPLDASDSAFIRDYVQSRAKNGLYQVSGRMGVLWWEVA